MTWIKKGLVFAPDRRYDWMASHAAVPIADDAGDGVLRIYFGARDTAGRSQTSYIEVDAARPERVLYVHDRPLLALGKPGTFDDSGIMPSWIVNDGPRKYLYYIGWNREETVAYRLAIGLAVSEDGGRTFQKVSEGPVCDRSFDEPFFVASPCVLREGHVWRMWYVSCTGWETICGRPEPRYHIKHAESSDGLSWRQTHRPCLDYDARTGAIARPCVYREGAGYRMLYSYRGIEGYRDDPAQSYRLGYAESDDGLIWTRRDDRVGIERSETGWDSEMIEYCFIHRRERVDYLFYNGNGFGRTGFGYAVRHEGP